jgi:hypothetical protein
VSASGKEAAIAEVVEAFMKTASMLVLKHRLRDPRYILTDLWPRLIAWDGNRDEGDAIASKLRAVVDPTPLVTDVRYAMMSAMADIAKIWRVYS